MTSDSPFGEMKGINAPREIAVHTASKLDQLVSMGNDIIEKYHSAVKGRLEWWEHHETYTAIEAELAGSELKYDVGDLQELVTAYGNKDDNPEEAITRGMYTGALASVLTQRNNKNGVRTPIYLNGDGNTFPYLLYLAHTLDEATVENFSGDRIARYAASYGGTANSITLANITGDEAGEYIAHDHGRVKTVTLATITGYGAGRYIASNKGHVGAVTLATITGNRAGETIARYEGRAETVTLANIIGDYAGGSIACQTGRVGVVTLATITGDWIGGGIASIGGCVGTVTFANITGVGAGTEIARDNGHVETATLANIIGDLAGGTIALHEGRVNTLLAVNNKGKDYLQNNHASRTITSLNGLANAQQIQSLLDELAQPDRAPEQYATASRQLGELLKVER